MPTWTSDLIGWTPACVIRIKNISFWDVTPCRMIGTKVSEKHLTSIFMTLFCLMVAAVDSSESLLPLIRLHGVTYQKTIIFTKWVVICVRSNISFCMAETYTQLSESSLACCYGQADQLKGCEWRSHQENKKKKILIYKGHGQHTSVLSIHYHVRGHV